ncbi:glycolipid transfer protein isoform X2 [Copidosoma floridanum]|uniref:glycolipid transfer protein isoform X2 n=1 Tax=Copidosoma floridanum TaxID=29053 RepID=UPI0006C9609D|nr:glycolipid transfer protein isoform X2 [Copidosoma floridanum]
MSVLETMSSRRTLRSSSGKKKGNNDDAEAESCEEVDLRLPMFPELVAGEISSEEFLAAAEGVVGMLDYFGKLFMPVKCDMRGNVNKLVKRMNVDKKNHDTLQKMLLLEKDKTDSPVAIDALMWLRRGLHMIQLFFEHMVNDFHAEQQTEDLVANLKKSYELSLEPYHGYMIQQLFGLLSRMIPTRTQIFRALANGCDVEQRIVIRNVDRFCKRLRANVTNLEAFYDEHNLENNYKV